MGVTIIKNNGKVVNRGSVSISEPINQSTTTQGNVDINQKRQITNELRTGYPVQEQIVPIPQKNYNNPAIPDTHWKAPVQLKQLLPLTGNQIDDARVVENGGNPSIYICIGITGTVDEQWKQYAPGIDYTVTYQASANAYNKSVQYTNALVETVSSQVNEHNELQGIDGGTTNQYYHLTQAEYNNKADKTWVSSQIVSGSGYSYSQSVAYTDALSGYLSPYIDIRDAYILSQANSYTNSSSGWSLSGNTGTSSASNYIGTADDNDVILKRNGIKLLSLTSTGPVLADGSYITAEAATTTSTTTRVNIDNSSPKIDTNDTGGTDLTFSDNYLAFQFNSGTSTTIRGGYVYMKRSGTITASNAQFTVRLYTDNAGQPGTQVLASTIYSPLASTNLSTNYVKIYFRFGISTPTLTASTNYWIVIDKQNHTGGTLLLDTLNSGNKVCTATVLGTWTTQNNTVRFGLWGTSGGYAIRGFNEGYLGGNFTGGVYQGLLVTSLAGNAIVASSYTSDAIQATAQIGNGIFATSRSGGYAVYGSAMTFSQAGYFIRSSSSGETTTSNTFSIISAGTGTDTKDVLYVSKNTGTAGVVARFNMSSASYAGSAMVVTRNSVDKFVVYATGETVVGSGLLDTTNPEMLRVDATGRSGTSVSVASFLSNYNNYQQLNLKNSSNGIWGSSDLVATADTGTETTNFIDLGINGSGYTQPTFNIGGALCGYLYTNGGDLTIGTASADKVIKFHTDGTTLSQLRLTISDTDSTFLNTVIASSGILTTTIQATSLVTPSVYGGTVAGDNLTIRPNSANATSGTIQFTGSKESTAYNIGSAVFSGGVGIAKNVNILKNLNVYGDTHVFGSNSNMAGTSITLNALDASYRSFLFASASSSRWGLLVDDSMESGGNAGSDFIIRRYDDTATALSDALKISRSTGIATFSHTPTVTGSQIATQMYTDATVFAASGNLANYIDVRDAYISSQLGGKTSISQVESATGYSYNLSKQYTDTLVETVSSQVNEHNELQGIQGGTTNQYYHLTSADYANRADKTYVSSLVETGSAYAYTQSVSYTDSASANLVSYIDSKTSSPGWSLTGNSGTTAGTNFVGTTDDINVVFKRNNIVAGYLGKGEESTAFGTYAGGGGVVFNGGNTLVGYAAGYSSPSYMTAIGTRAYMNGSNAQHGVAIGYFAGRYETGWNALYIDSYDRGSEALGKSDSLIYGTFDATPANQTLAVNAVLSSPYTATINISGNAGTVTNGVYLNSTQTLTNKRITKRVVTTADNVSAIIDVDITDIYELSAIANATVFSVTGSPTDGQSLIIRFKDAGVAKGLTWTGFTPIGIILPTTTTVGKWGYVGCQYNLASTAWHVIAVGQES